jgi:hypothetical protein
MVGGGGAGRWIAVASVIETLLLDSGVNYFERWLAGWTGLGLVGGVAHTSACLIKPGNEGDEGAGNILLLAITIIVMREGREETSEFKGASGRREAAAAAAAEEEEE